MNAIASAPIWSMFVGTLEVVAPTPRLSNATPLARIFRVGVSFQAVMQSPSVWCPRTTRRERSAISVRPVEFGKDAQHARIAGETDVEEGVDEAPQCRDRIPTRRHDDP